MDIKILEVYYLSMTWSEGMRDYESVQNHVKSKNLLPLLREYDKFVLIDRETAEKYNLESDLTLAELYSHMDFYDDLELSSDIVKNYEIVRFETLKERKIPELASAIVFSEPYKVYKDYDDSEFIFL